jgi:hypothetical protein
MKKYGGLQVYLHAFITLELERDEQSDPPPGRSISWTTAPGAQRRAGRVWRSVGLDVMKQRKFSVPLE